MLKAIITFFRRLFGCETYAPEPQHPATEKQAKLPKKED